MPLLRLTIYVEALQFILHPLESPIGYTSLPHQGSGYVLHSTPPGPSIRSTQAPQLPLLPHLLRPSLGKTRAGLLCQGFTFTNQRKVNYTLSYLSGSAKEWFVPDILDPDLDLLLAWTSSFKAIVKEPQDNFGVYDMQGDTEDSLEYLKMKETENIRKYNIQFNTLAASTNWDSAALK
ncbi:hypothetical protein EV368DRAFT_83610 [Lentinula lateritia]|nr:hypothetical protein EV368DRAFT_83610 [Lentinula lateritia]